MSENFTNVFTAGLNETAEDRATMLGWMNNLVMALNDESYYFDQWIAVVPDEADYDDLFSIAENDEFYAEAVECFLTIMAQVYEEEK